MIQRKQTVFLFLALLTTIACLCLPVGSFEPKGMGAESMLMNLWISDANGGKDFNVWALFAILLVTCPINLFAIFDYHNRQASGSFLYVLHVNDYWLVCGLWCVQPSTDDWLRLPHKVCSLSSTRSFHPLVACTPLYPC